jgi:hypothetical protein
MLASQARPTVRLELQRNDGQIVDEASVHQEDRKCRDRGCGTLKYLSTLVMIQEALCQPNLSAFGNGILSISIAFQLCPSCFL